MCIRDRAIRERVLAGRLGAGEKLPSTRALALALRIARSTVVQAYDRLRAEGYIETVRGSGTRVAARQPRPLAGAPDAPPPSPLAPAARSLPFQPGIPDLLSLIHI